MHTDVTPTHVPQIQFQCTLIILTSRKLDESIACRFARVSVHLKHDFSDSESGEEIANIAICAGVEWDSFHVNDIISLRQYLWRRLLHLRRRLLGHDCGGRDSEGLDDARLPV